MKLFATATLAATLACVTLPYSPAWSSSGATLFKQVRVFDGEKRAGIRDVLVTDGRIVCIGRRVAAPAGATTIDGRGKTLLPGLMDAHVHVFPTAAEDALRFGVTTEFDMFTMSDPGATRARREQRASLKRTDKADVWSAGQGVTRPGAHPTGLAKKMGFTFPTLDEDGDAAAFVAAQVAEGADHIKIFQDASPQGGKPRYLAYSDRQLAATITAAHRNGRKAVVHVSQESDGATAIRLGADALAHIFDDQPASEETVRLAKARKATIIATLSVLAGAAGDPTGQSIAQDHAIKPLLSFPQAGTLSQKFGRPRPSILQNAMASVRRLHAAGVRILAGTDAPNPTTAHGASMHGELELLVRSGLTPAEALRAGTADVADFFGTQDRGRIRPGQRADLLLVEGDPTADIAQTRRIVGIWKNGFPVDRAVKAGMPAASRPKP